MLGLLPPVGAAIICRIGGALPAFPGYKTTWLSSGTAALSLAMREAGRLRMGVSAPEVVLPAYGCPDLVAAAVYAGLQPVLADVGFEDPGYRLDVLDSVLTERTVAVVAVNFLGIAERLPEIREVLERRSGIALIEDSAQWYPSSSRALVGDFVCLSFGRGKPVSVLTGGALLRKLGMGGGSDVDAKGELFPPVKARGCWEIRLHNALLRPALYRIVNSVPGTGLGNTRFKELAEIRGFPKQRLSLLPANVERYLVRSTAGATRLSLGLEGMRGIVDLSQMISGRVDRLLRFPILLPCVRSRDAAIRKLVRCGIGATRLYGLPLPSTRGVGSLVKFGEVAGAKAFAERLLTIPVRAGDSDARIDAVRRALSGVINGN